VRLGSNSKVDLIKGVPLFASASKQELAEIASIADEIDLPEGKVLIREGDTGREFFVLIDGTADVTQKGKRISTLGPGDFFGEIALVSRIPRTATVTTTSPARALVISAHDFRSLVDRSPAVALQVLEAVAERLPTAIQ
jgi:CRP/FNR family transcriptional regulator, cyclic AMP receptor protein